MRTNEIPLYCIIYHTYILMRKKELHVPSTISGLTIDLTIFDKTYSICLFNNKKDIHIIISYICVAQN